eukprot:CAMPEP_0119496198 /NCGR_PEP_ID=MMETSP1344-20130328/19599_1 /TAXON_ID=236787 /ORGANISM="Florenciella parvula, Strain CCMP2471" /LENGTH=309 /DNA_ID=CAMNT_0007531857 /DNA_START=326 /DNA_END=1251 /DNA_ORIENTATION=-
MGNTFRRGADGTAEVAEPHDGRVVMVVDGKDGRSATSSNMHERTPIATEATRGGGSASGAAGPGPALARGPTSPSSASASASPSASGLASSSASSSSSASAQLPAAAEAAAVARSIEAEDRSSRISLIQSLDAHVAQSIGCLSMRTRLAAGESVDVVYRDLVHMLNEQNNLPPPRPLPAIEPDEDETELLFADRLWVPSKPRIELPEGDEIYNVVLRGTIRQPNVELFGMETLRIYYPSGICVRGSNPGLRGFLVGLRSEGAAASFTVMYERGEGQYEYIPCVGADQSHAAGSSETARRGFFGRRVGGG